MNKTAKQQEKCDENGAVLNAQISSVQKNFEVFQNFKSISARHVYSGREGWVVDLYGFSDFCKYKIIN